MQCLAGLSNQRKTNTEERKCRAESGIRFRKLLVTSFSYSRPFLIVRSGGHHLKPNFKSQELDTYRQPTRLFLQIPTVGV